MHILFAVHGYKPAYRLGGPIHSVSALAERLVHKGHKVTVFTTNSNLDEDLDVPVNQPIDVDGVEVWYFRREEPLQRWLPFVAYLSRSSGFLYAPHMKEQLERIVPLVDVVHAHLPFIYPTYAASKAAFRHRKPFFYNQRGVFDLKRLQFRSAKKKLYISLLEKPILQRATTLVALTEAEVNSYRALGIQTRIHVIPNGIDSTAYRTEPVSDTDVRWNIPSGSPVILFLGRLHPIKGADKLLEAFLQVVDRYPDAVLVLAGPDEALLEEKFRNIVQQRGLQKRVLFPGMVTGEEKLDLLARADIFVLPSVGEGFSMAILEAMASSTAVLISPGCHFPEVDAAGAGMIVPDTVNAVAEALDGLLGQPDKIRAMGRAGRELVSSRYTWERITDQMLEIYAEGIQYNQSFWSRHL